MKKLVSIVAPMYNEESLVQVYCNETLRVIRQLQETYDFEIVLVNDGSKDNTYTLMQEEQKKNPMMISTICLSRNFGLEGAVNAGIRKAVGDAVIVMDADLQDPPALIPEMIKKWENGADIVVGSRIKRSNDSFLKRFGANSFYKVLNVFCGKLKMEKSAANFRLLSRDAVNCLLKLPEVNNVFRVTVPFIGMKTDIVEYDRDKRYTGRTKYNLRSMASYALDSITGISVAPLRIIVFFLPVSVIALIGFVCGAVIITDIWWKAVCAEIAVMSFFFLLLFAGLSIMAEYLAQIMIEVKGRPISIVYEYIACENVKKRQG